MKNMELIYFPCTGRAGLTRLMLKMAKIDYKETIVGWDQWNEDEKSKYPLGALPVLKVDGEEFCQTWAIEEFLAQKLGLYGDSPLDGLKIDMIRETYVECVRVTVMSKCMPVIAKEFEIESGFKLKDTSLENRQKRGERLAEIAGPAIIEGLSQFEKILEQTQTNSEFAVGEKITLADLTILSLFLFSNDWLYKRGFSGLREAVPRKRQNNYFKKSGN